MDPMTAATASSRQLPLFVRDRGDFAGLDDLVEV
jgi:predicted nucleic acid-binding protein